MSVPAMVNARIGSREATPFLEITKEKFDAMATQLKGDPLRESPRGATLWRKTNNGLLFGPKRRGSPRLLPV